MKIIACILQSSFHSQFVHLIGNKDTWIDYMQYNHLLNYNSYNCMHTYKVCFISQFIHLIGNKDTWVDYRQYNHLLNYNSYNCMHT